MGIILNEDCNHFLYSRKNIIESVDEDYLNGFIDQYADTLVTDFVMNISATLSFVPSTVLQFAADKYLVKSEYGKDVDYTETELAGAYHLWYEKKLDMYRIWIDRCRFNGINPWFSFRMNDAEVSDLPSHLLSEYYYEHFLEYSRVRHRQPQSALECCRDYEIDEYRNRQLAYIEEIVGKYDVYGVELDFQREIYCLRPGHEWNGAQIMTDFMRSVKNITDTASSKWGHPIKTAVRCHAHPEDSRELGFDIYSWAKLGLVDRIIPSPNWLTSDNDMPLTLWRDMMESFDVEVIGCIDRNLNSNPDYFETILKDYEKYGLRRHSYETLCASAVNILSQIPGDIYLFNHMDCPATAEESMKNWSFSEEEYQKILKSAGDLESIIKLPRRHVITYNDTVLPWKKSNAVLPLVFDSALDVKYLRIITGTVPPDMICVLRLGIENIDVKAKVYVNSVEVVIDGMCECEEPILTNSKLYCFNVPAYAVMPHAQIVEIVAENMVVDYADIFVSKAKNVIIGSALS